MDIYECLGASHFNKRKLKIELEEYLQRMGEAGRLPWCGYFQCDFIDEKTGKTLKLFIQEGANFGYMQCWELVGVCLAKDWSIELEEDGYIRRWLKTKIEDAPDEIDDSIVLRVAKVINNTMKTKFKNVLQEVLNEFENEEDKRVAEKLALLQELYFE